MSDGTQQKIYSIIFFVVSIAMIFKGLDILKDGLEIKKFEESATKEYVIGKVVENFYLGTYDKATSFYQVKNKYYPVFSFGYTHQDGTVNQNTITPITTGSNSKSKYKVGTTGQIVIFNQDVTTARYDSNGEKIFLYYHGIVLILFFSFAFIYSGATIYFYIKKIKSEGLPLSYDRFFE